MGDPSHHAKLASENLNGAHDEYSKKRYSNTALLAIRALEQVVEACAAKEGIHFHEHPRTAHAGRRGWLRSRHPDLVRDWDTLWSIYGALGYGGVDGERASHALEALDRLVGIVRKRENIELPQS